MTRDEIDEVSRVAVARARVVVDDVLTEFRSREMGHVDAEVLIEDIRRRLHDDLLLLISLPEVKHSGR